MANNDSDREQYSRDAAQVTRERGEVASRMKDPENRKQFIARQGEEERKHGGKADLRELSDEAYRERNRQASGTDSYRKGGKVRRGGVVRLHKGERIKGRKTKKRGRGRA